MSDKSSCDKVGIKCTMDVLLPTDDDNANIIIEYNGIIKKLLREAEKLELDTDAIKDMMRDLEFKNSFVRMDSRNMEIKKLTLSDIKKVVEMIEDRYSYALYMTEEYG